MFQRDKSKRSTRIINYYRTVVACLVAIVLCFFWYVAGSIRYGQVVESSSTPVGSVLDFTRSKAKVSVAGIYTDKTRSAMVVRLHPISENDAARLPANGSDFQAFVSNGKFSKKVSEMDILYGRLSSDGDFFLVIPRPNKDVYSVFLMNTKFLQTKDSSELGDDRKIQNLDGSEKSITSALSQYTYDPENKGNVYSIKDNMMDVISFRITMDPAFKKKEYKPIVLDTLLIDNDGKFNYSGMFTKLFKESAYGELEAKHNNLLSEEKVLQSTLDEYLNRLKRNPDDTVAIKEGKKVENSLKNIADRKAKIAAQMNQYESLTFDNDLFVNLQTTARVVHP